MSHLRLATLLAAILTTAAGCGLPGSVGEPPPDCQIPSGSAFAFAGKSTLAELGLDDAGPYRHLPGTAYVTAGPVAAQGSPERWWCIVFDETAGAEEWSVSGVAAYGPLMDTDWRPPAAP